MWNKMSTANNSNDPNTEHFNKGWLNEVDLLEVINEMGYNITTEELSTLRDDIENFIDEDEMNNSHDDEGNISLFSSLCFSDNYANRRQPSGTENASRSDTNVFDHARCLNNAKSIRRSHLRRNLPSIVDSYGPTNQRTLHQKAFSLTRNEEVDVDRDAISDLIYEGYLCMERLYADNARLSQLTKHLRKSRSSSNHIAAPSNERIEEEVVANDEGLPERDEGDQEGWLSPVYSSTEGDSSPVECSPDTDPSIRPVLCPLPGGVPFRHDPVKKFELYQREWRRNPPPGEKKRLSLRWKVREYMLRQDISSIKAKDLGKKRPPNPEWVPKSYL
uniref:Centriolar and ciliogenesis-associated protein HYLS1 C-terminal domain-containing protein n=1 Tax=Parascaris univalens TaxID=6257 RepID=A0A915AEJ7_PARUN